MTLSLIRTCVNHGIECHLVFWILVSHRTYYANCMVGLQNHKNSVSIVNTSTWHLKLRPSNLCTNNNKLSADELGSLFCTCQSRNIKLDPTHILNMSFSCTIMMIFVVVHRILSQKNFVVVHGNGMTLKRKWLWSFFNCLDQHPTFKFPFCASEVMALWMLRQSSS